MVRIRPPKKAKPFKLIQRKHSSTSNQDPGMKCPKCGASLCFSYDDDQTVFCANAMDSNSCDFQYTFTERELKRNRDKEWAVIDQEAKEKTAEFVKEHGGRIVFGEVSPEEFVLPSHKWRDDF